MVACPPLNHSSEKTLSLLRRQGIGLLSSLFLEFGATKVTKEQAGPRTREKWPFGSCHADSEDKDIMATPSSSATYGPPSDKMTQAFVAFLREFPQYKLTSSLDALRRSDYSRLDSSGETYVDYMGGALYPDRLIKAHTNFLHQSVLGNTHSVSNSSILSSNYVNEARREVLEFLRAPEGYSVIFTANATGALKLIGESYPFSTGSTYVLGADSHNSLNGIREYATAKNADVCYIPSTPTGGFDLSIAHDILLRHKPRSSVMLGLFALTALSNISNCKNPLSIIEYAASLGYHTILDAAALVPTSAFSLTDYPVDAMAISFYKMFGFPTGVGALVVKDSFLAQLRRPWFSGGTVDVVQVPGTIFTRAHDLHEQFEDGTINYLLLPAITTGLRFLSQYLPLLPLRLSCLLQYLVSSLATLRHDDTQNPVVRILSRVSGRVMTLEEQSETGATISLLFLGPHGELLPNSFIEFSASKRNISLRTGCVCNPGGAAALLGIEDGMDRLYPGVTLEEFGKQVGKELGVVRLSLGLASNFQDAWEVVQFARSIGSTKPREAFWNQWTEKTGKSFGR